jgi:uncharacterized membrane protein
MKYALKALLICLMVLLPLSTTASAGHAQEPVVRAVFFYSTNCPYCLEVINEVLPALDKQYGTQLQIFGINASTGEGSRLYEAAVEAFDIPEEKLGFPTLIVDDHILVGAKQIPEQLPTIVEEGLASGGIDWPYFPGLEEEMEAAEQRALESEQAETENGFDSKEKQTVLERFKSDLVGNIVSVVVLLGMISVVLMVGFTYNQRNFLSNPPDRSWLIPVISLLGIAVASYLSYVEITRTDAVCGPVGNCNIVQQSPYAFLFGFLPVGVVGIAGYLSITAAWLVLKMGSPTWKENAKIALWVLSLIGVLFSIYLTFLEPFVIGASCSWCHSSAVLITILFIIATREFKTSAVYQKHIS